MAQASGHRLFSKQVPSCWSGSLPQSYSQTGAGGRRERRRRERGGGGRGRKRRGRKEEKGRKREERRGGGTTETRRMAKRVILYPFSSTLFLIRLHTVHVCWTYWACSEHHPKPIHVVSWGSSMHHFNSTACQTKGHWPERTLYKYVCGCVWMCVHGKGRKRWTFFFLKCM